MKINADLAPALSQRFDVRSIPTLMVFRGGKVVAKQIGAAPAGVLRPWLEGALGQEAR